LQKGLAYKLNPDDAMAMVEALKFKEVNPDSEITLISIGPEKTETYLREGMAMGADRAFRIWQEGFEDLSSFQKACLLSAAVSLLSADLVLTGAKSLDNSSGLVGPLIAARLNLPCVCDTTGFQVDRELQVMTVTRNTGKGLREKVMAALPAVLTIAGSRGKLPYVSLDRMLASQEAEISCLGLLDLGLSSGALKNDPVRVVGLSFPHPRPKAAPLDSSLPAFYRILALLQGGMSKRRGEILQGSQDEVIEQIYKMLVNENIIRP
jgi:electron transfer flavoprotein beta subunit